MVALRIPAHFDEITSEWFAAALRMHGAVSSVDFAAFQVTPLDPHQGLLGDLARVEVNYRTGDGPSSFIVKLPTADPESRQVGTMLRAWEREVAFYRHVAPISVGARLPQCYYAAGDAQTGRWVVVLEECQSDDFDYLAGASIEQANAAVDALADFHAQWWQSTTTFDWMPGLDNVEFGGLQELWAQNLPHFLDRYRQVVPPEAAEWVQRFAPTLASWAARAGADQLTMVHADYRIDNLLFDGDQVTMIDWQTTMRAPAAMDLSCFIATSLTIADRRHYEQSLIDRYLDRVGSAGIDVDRQWFLCSYDENLLWWMGQFGNNLAHLDAGPHMNLMLKIMVERVFTAAVDRDIAYLLTAQ